MPVNIGLHKYILGLYLVNVGLHMYILGLYLFVVRTGRPENPPNSQQFPQHTNL